MNSALCIMLFYIIGGLLGLSFLVIPSNAVVAKVVVYVLCQVKFYNSGFSLTWLCDFYHKFGH